MPGDEQIVDVLADSDFESDPEEIIRTKITPRALKKLYENLDSDVPNVVDRAIEKAIAIDKRLAKKDLPQQPNQTLNLINFPPEYLSKIGEGIKTMFGGNVAAKALPDQQGVPADASPESAAVQQGKPRSAVRSGNQRSRKSD